MNQHDTGTVPGQPLVIGFAGLGTMGEAMALRLAEAGVRLVVWNRTPERCAPLQAAGAETAPDMATLFARCDPVMLMLADADAIRAVLGVGTPALRQRVDGRTVVQMGTIGLSDSRTLAEAVAKAGGTYVEAPVSGSRKQAEAVHVAHHLGVPPARLAETLLAGPMANDVLRVKLPKLVASDWSTQAAIRNVHDNCRLILQAAEASSAATPVLAACEALYARAIDAGLGEQDMVAVRQTFEETVLNAVDERRSTGPL